MEEDRREGRSWSVGGKRAAITALEKVLATVLDRKKRRVRAAVPLFDCRRSPLPVGVSLIKTEEERGRKK